MDDMTWIDWVVLVGFFGFLFTVLAVALFVDWKSGKYRNH